MELTLEIIYACVAVTAGFFIGNILGYIINKAGRDGGEDRGIRPGIARFLARMVRYVSLLASVGVAMGILGFGVSPIAAVLGALGLAVALAVRGRMSSFVAGIQILIFRPLEIGHRVTIAGKTGKVTDIGLFAITLKLPDGTVAIINNNSVVNGTIVNLTDEKQRLQKHPLN